MKWLPVLLLLTGCGAFDTREARNPAGSLIGSDVPGLIGCMGKPDAVQQTGPDTAILQWNHEQTDQGLSFSVSIFASLQIGTGGGCKMVATVLRDGTVADITFPGSFSTGLISAPYSECGPIVEECLHHPGATVLPAKYDAFVWLLPKDGKP